MWAEVCQLRASMDFPESRDQRTSFRQARAASSRTQGQRREAGEAARASVRTVSRRTGRGAESGASLLGQIGRTHRQEPLCPGGSREERAASGAKERIIGQHQILVLQGRGPQGQIRSPGTEPTAMRAPPGRGWIQHVLLRFPEREPWSPGVRRRDPGIPRSASTRTGGADSVDVRKDGEHPLGEGSRGGRRRWAGAPGASADRCRPGRRGL